MTYTVTIDPQAKKALQKLDTETAERILSKLDDLKQKPAYFAKPLTGIDLWRLRVGDYRVLFDLYREDNEIYVVKIGHRKDIYDQL